MSAHRSESTRQRDEGRAETPRDRILQTAYELFRDHGVHAVGVDRIVAEAGVAKTTLYRHFPSKDDLVVAALELREQLWTWDWLMGEVERRADTPAEKLLAFFDAFDEWFHRPDFEGCFFTNTLLELRDRVSPVGAASVVALANVRGLLTGYAKEAGARDPESFARKWQALLWGALVGAATGDSEAAARARELGLMLLANETPAAA
jgi:AcrR family transcriptional regulator